MRLVGRGSWVWVALWLAVSSLAASSCAGRGGGPGAERAAPPRRPANAVPAHPAGGRPASPAASATPAAVTTSTAVAGRSIPSNAQRDRLSRAPSRALLLGDGVMYDAAPALEAALRAGGVARVVAAPRFGFGLTRPEAYDWRREWPSLLAVARPDLVVLMVGPWDLRTIEVGGRRLAPGRPGWEAFYGTLADEAVAILTSGGARLLWVGTAAAAPDPALVARVAAFNAVVRHLLARHGRVSFVDAWAALAGPNGQVTPVEAGADGVPVRVLKPDGEHLCPAGAARLAAAVAAAVPVDPGDAWQDGPWRADGRYHWAAGGGCPPA